ncbi:mismatch-specific DNA-glycosylase [Agromyces seonyuensis]|uniref:Mismatch-specific DNA-glycosylase n=1 Tax=Agromyces seonyuensis TaxID=2662446 RepID=A0A6I4NUI8_9MICO|nr:mismatch-specific DNA-glycosylase [Agromyces seonyuensis]MWB98116.1 mismatch-specific DNA-glycosylase [Agromyces seonyuensis]
MGFTREELAAFHGAAIPDTLPDGELRLLFCGINPGLWTAAVGAPFARRGNRFYPALERAGIFDRVVDASAGLSSDDHGLFDRQGVGVTSLVPFATARADELTRDQLVEGAAALEEKVDRLRPKVVAMLGVTAYRVGFGRPRARVGVQPERLAGAELHVVPNPSGLNAHATLDSLATAYLAAAVAAGVPLFAQRARPLPDEQP